MPKHALAALALFGVHKQKLQWSDAHTHHYGICLKPYQRLGERITAADMKRFVDQVITSHAEPVEPQTQSSATPEGLIDLEQFTRTHLIVAKIRQAREIENADRLLCLELDTGHGTKTVLAGIRQWYQVGELEDRLVILVDNLKPRKTKFGVSEGMILAASHGQGRPYLIRPDEGAEPGMRLR